MEKDNILFLQQFFGNDKKKEIVQKRNETIKKELKIDDTNIHKDCNLKINNLYNINNKFVKEIRDLQNQLDELSKWKNEHVCKCNCGNNINIEDNSLFIEIKNQNELLNESNKIIEEKYNNIKIDNDKIQQQLLDLQHNNENIKEKQKKDIDSKYSNKFISLNKVIEDFKIEIHNKEKVIYNLKNNKTNKKEDLLLIPAISTEIIKEKIEKNTEDKINNVIDKIINNNNLIKDEEDRLKLKNENRCKIDTLSFFYEKYGDNKNNNIKPLSISYDKNSSRFKKMMKIYSLIKNNIKLYNSNLLFQYHTFDNIGIKDDLVSLINKMENKLII